LCYLLEGTGLLFTGDHVMQGSTVVISPPDGDMHAYFASLNKLSGYDISAFAPGHGRVIETPREEVAKIIAHRLKREQMVVDALTAAKVATLDELVPVVYSDVSPNLHVPARRSLHAHLLKLAIDRRAAETGGQWRML
jgi:glyoxylase-like metal-dependent hydrolase (beta-lactamase superfamily II)